MNEQVRYECTPADYLRRMFEETADGKLAIEYDDVLGNTYTKTYDMDWTADDADALVERLISLTDALNRISHTEDIETLSEDDRKVFDIYLRPFEPFEGDAENVRELYERHECGYELSEEESDLLEHHHEWFVENSLKRLPVGRCYPHHLINRVQRYEALIRLGAPTSIIDAEGCFLAEELALYHHRAASDPHNIRRFLTAQEDAYPTALAELRSGQKRTHWMWFLFPQLRALGQSETSLFYGLADETEARAYLFDTVLGARLFRLTETLLSTSETDPVRIFGEIDARKLQSSMTLFAHLCGKNSVFAEVLNRFFGGKSDARTLALLNAHNNGYERR